MDMPPFMWLGSEAIPAYVAWQEAEQASVDAALIAAATCPIVDATDEE
jgi:predicted transcriptional regulator